VLALLAARGDKEKRRQDEKERHERQLWRGAFRLRLFRRFVSSRCYLLISWFVQNISRRRLEGVFCRGI
jgi:hypothetical protein